MVARATGIGSMPVEGPPATAYAEAVRFVLGELPDLPYVPELPGRGPEAGMTGRALALVAELGFDLQPDGWRLTDAPGVDHRRARSLLAQDLDTVEELAQEYAGSLKLQVCGPWTLAATVERPRGDRILADVGARRELAQALAEGLRAHVADVRRRVPGAEILVQVDEPALPSVLAGAVPTASGFGRHRSVDAPRASALLEEVFGAVEESGATSLAHCCAADVPVALLRGAGARGISVDVAVLAASAYDGLGECLDDGGTVLLGVLPALPADPAARPDPRAALAAARRLLGMLGHDPEEVADQVVLTPACGLAGAPPAYAEATLRALATAARDYPG